MAGYQAIGGINPYMQSYGQGYGNYGQSYGNYAQQISDKYSTQSSVSYPANINYSTNTCVENTELSEEAKKKRRNKTLLIAGGVLVTGVTTAILCATQGKGSGVIDKIKSAAKTCWQKVKNIFSSKAKTDDAGEAVLDTVEMIQKGGKTTLRLPEAKQVLNGKTDKIVTAVKDLGIDSVAKEVTEATSKVKTSTMTIHHKGVKTFVTLGNSGKIFCKGADGKMLNLAEQSADYQKLVNETIDAIKGKQLNKIDPSVQIQNIVYDSKIANGTVGTYLHKGGAKTGTSEIRRIITDRFDVGSDEVHALMKDNKKLREAVEKATPTRKHWFSLPKSADYSNWNIRSATHTPTVKNWPEKAHILIENNEIVGVIENGVRVNETRLKALQYRFPKAFEDVLEKELDNVVRYLP